MKQIQISEIKLDQLEIDAALRVLRSGALRQGKECEAFEREFAEKVGAEYAIASSSGTAALHLAYMATLERGDEVLVPSFTFIATASMVTVTQAKPVFCDIDPRTFLIDLDDAAKRVTSRTRAIAPVHLFGNACNVDAIMSFAKKHNLKVIWDAAQAHGAMFNSRNVGAFPDFVCYSFYPSKNMFVGEGGMTCTSNLDYYEKMKFMRSHGQTGKYYHTMLGLNYRMTDVEAAIGRQQLRRLDSMLEARRNNALYLDDGISAIPGIYSQWITRNSVHAWHQYCVYVDPENFGCDRDAVAEHLKEKGIATGVHYPRGVHMQPIFEQLYGRTYLPNTEKVSRGILALPVHHGLQEDDLYRIIEAVEERYDRGPQVGRRQVGPNSTVPNRKVLETNRHYSTI
jgi:perosamine synthetase